MMESQVGQEMMDSERCQEGSRPSILLAYTDAAYASQCGRYFRRLGWEVRMVASGAEARELALEYRPDVVALDVALLDQSGWLTSAKISLEKPDLRIILVADRQTNAIDDRLHMVGADHAVYREDGAQALVETVFGKSVFSEAV
jgi:DNA-binding response OmpR family regulator